MDLKKIASVVEEVNKGKQRKFTQTYDFILNIKDIDLKKTENQIEFFTNLHYSKGRKIKVCALIGGELKEDAEKHCDKVILSDSFTQYAEDKKVTKKLAEEFDFFIAQATVMQKVATIFGKVFGPRGKMPNPKSGCVVAPKQALKPIMDKLQTTVKVSLKKGPVVHAFVGSTNQPQEEVVDNIKTLYDAILHNLPNEEQNIRSVYIKLSMGTPVRLL